jgi:hypothetical protein
MSMLKAVPESLRRSTTGCGFVIENDNLLASCQMTLETQDPLHRIDLVQFETDTFSALPIFLALGQHSVVEFTNGHTRIFSEVGFATSSFLRVTDRQSRNSVFRKTSDLEPSEIPLWLQGGLSFLNQGTLERFGLARLLL